MSYYSAEDAERGVAGFFRLVMLIELVVFGVLLFWK